MPTKKIARTVDLESVVTVGYVIVGANCSKGKNWIPSASPPAMESAKKALEASISSTPK
jgi:hypothetical protein